MHIDAKGNDLLPDASDEELIMKKVVTCSQMKLLDHETIHSMHVPSLVLMERAALAVRDEIVKYLLGKNPDRRVRAGSRDAVRLCGLQRQKG